MKTISLFRLYYVYLAITIAVVGCKEDEGKNPIIGTWEVTKYETKTGSQTTWTNITSTDCHADNKEEYSSDGDWTLYDGADLCGSGASLTTGTWRLVANNTTVIYTYDGFGGEYESTVEQLSSATMILVYGAGDINNTQYRTTYSKL